MKTHNLFSLLILIFVFNSCSKNKLTESDVIANYARLVSKSYLDSYTTALSMQSAINDFLENPTEDGLKKAKEAWLVAREIYGQTEVYRETNSPIDVKMSGIAPWGIANEAQMNAWPIDEAYIDYVKAGTEEFAGDYRSIIADSTKTITQSLLVDLNEKVTDKSISTGWHTIEFLLWGQDNSSPKDNLPGNRAFTDYTTHINAERRGQYLKIVTSLLVADLKSLADTWSKEGEYRIVFEKLDPKVALRQLVNGAFFMAGDELSSERMIAPVDSTDGLEGSGQEDEHSCFSDNTHRDVYANALGVNNVVFGNYDKISGVSFYDLVKQENETEAEKLKKAADDVMKKVTIIANSKDHFDYLITRESSSDSDFGPIMQAVVSLQALSDQISISANSIGINLR